MSKTVQAAAAAAAAPLPPPLADETRRQREDDERKEEMEALRAEVALRRRQAAIAAQRGLLPQEEALGLVAEKDIAFSYRSSLKTQHAMRLVREHERPNGPYQEVDKCLACHKTWSEILTESAEDHFKFFNCPQRDAWEKARDEKFKNSKAKRSTGF